MKTSTAWGRQKEERLRVGRCRDRLSTDAQTTEKGNDLSAFTYFLSQSKQKVGL